jgi:dolichol-phosphate mannosyltransferase
MNAASAHHIAVVIPCYRVRDLVADVIRRIGPEVNSIFVVDDKCPERTGDFVEVNIADPRVSVIRHDVNQGVGGAVMTGYRAALGAGADIIVKIDGDGQMDPALIWMFVCPIIAQEADYTKGNRFYDAASVQEMPRFRLFMNAGLSLLNKLSSGYWNIFDPTNGYTAIHAGVVALLPFEKIHKRYFFETDMLFRLNLTRAVLVDIPMSAVYGDEVSSIKYGRVFIDFALGVFRNFLKRIWYNYVLRDMSIATFELIFGLLLFFTGTVIGSYAWSRSIIADVPATSGTVMLAALPIILGIQFVLAFLSYDIQSVPSRPRQKSLLRNIFKDDARMPSDQIRYEPVIAISDAVLRGESG